MYEPDVLIFGLKTSNPLCMKLKKAIELHGLSRSL